MTELFPITELLTFVLFLAGPVWLAALSAAADARHPQPRFVEGEEFGGPDLGRASRREDGYRIDETTAGFPSTAVC